jgi:hypothetical protein
MSSARQVECPRCTLEGYEGRNSIGKRVGERGYELGRGPSETSGPTTGERLQRGRAVVRTLCRATAVSCDKDAKRPRRASTFARGDQARVRIGNISRGKYNCDAALTSALVLALAVQPSPAPRSPYHHERSTSLAVSPVNGKKPKSKSKGMPPCVSTYGAVGMTGAAV